MNTRPEEPEETAEQEKIAPEPPETAGEAENDMEIPALPGGPANSDFMQQAIEEALYSISTHSGGPIGSVIVGNGTVLGKGHDRSLTDGEGAHAEQQAIAEARKALNTEDLSGCILYTTAEPCTECLLACRAANIDFVRYGCTLDDCAEIGLETDLGEGEDAQIPRGYLVCSDRNACLRLFALYSERKAAD